MKKETPAVGTTYALTVNRWRILWTGNQMAGREQSQKMKKDTKSLVLVPEFGIPLGTVKNSESAFAQGRKKGAEAWKH
jgi:hypothetical protein